MKYAIDKDVITSMKDLKEGEISVVSTENYNTLLFGTQLSKITENKVEVGLKFIVRSTYSNEVLMIEDEIVQIFEYPNPENQNNVTGLAYFTINGMNFRIKGYHIA